MYTIGLTGGMGSGKSTVADLFAALGTPVIDTDLIAHQLTAPGGAALNAIRACFSEAVMRADGTLDRAALRRLVFGDVAARKQLEAIMHPRIRCEVERVLASLDAPYAMIVIPLLVETGGYPHLLNRVLLVDCPEALQIKRVMSRSGLGRDEVEAILAAQAGRAARLAVADDVILNTASLDGLRDQVLALHPGYLARAAAALP